MRAKILSAVALVSAMIVSSVSAGDGHSVNKHHPIPGEDFKLEYVIKDGKTHFNWNKSNSDYFKYYKLTYSATDSAPVYPKHTNKGYSGDINDTSKSVYAYDGYWRLCVVYKGYYDNNNDGSYVKCSNVVKLEGVKEKYETTKTYDKSTTYTDDRLEAYKNALADRLEGLYDKVEDSDRSISEQIAIYEKIQSRILDRKANTRSSLMRELLWYIHEELQARIDMLGEENFEEELEDLFDF